MFSRSEFQGESSLYRVLFSIPPSFALQKLGLANPNPNPSSFAMAKDSEIGSCQDRFLRVDSTISIAEIPIAP